MKTSNKATATKESKATTIRWNEEDRRLIAALMAQKRLRTVADVVRSALGDSARKEGIR